MKLDLAHKPGHERKSPPARGRGLKPHSFVPLPVDKVAPRAGAWIETKGGDRLSLATASPPARGRGLKQPGRFRN